MIKNNPFDQHIHYTAQYSVQEMPKTRVLTLAGGVSIDKQLLLARTTEDEVRVLIDTEIFAMFASERGTYLRDVALDIQFEYYNPVDTDTNCLIYRYTIHLLLREQDYAFYILKFQ